MAYIRCKYKSNKTTTESVITVDADDSRLTPIMGYTYSYSIYLNSTYYLYESNYPIYIYHTSSDKYIFIYADDTRRNGTKITSLNLGTQYGTKDSVVYYCENKYKRTASQIENTVCNYPIVDATTITWDEIYVDLTTV